MIMYDLTKCRAHPNILNSILKPLLVIYLPLYLKSRKMSPLWDWSRLCRRCEPSPSQTLRKSAFARSSRWAYLQC